MNLPDCYEADRQAEALAAEYDRRRAAFPKCQNCGNNLYDDDTYFEDDDLLLCMRCVSSFQEQYIAKVTKEIDQYIEVNARSTADLISDIYD